VASKHTCHLGDSNGAPINQSSASASSTDSGDLKGGISIGTYPEKNILPMLCIKPGLSDEKQIEIGRKKEGGYDVRLAGHGPSVDKARLQKSLCCSGPLGRLPSPTSTTSVARGDAELPDDPKTRFRQPLGEEGGGGKSEEQATGDRYRHDYV
jgi:hypothetical protein